MLKCLELQDVLHLLQHPAIGKMSPFERVRSSNQCKNASITISYCVGPGQAVVANDLSIYHTVTDMRCGIVATTVQSAAGGTKLDEIGLLVLVYDYYMYSG